MVLDEQPSELTTFNTPFGRYKKSDFHLASIAFKTIFSSVRNKLFQAKKVSTLSQTTSSCPAEMTKSTTAISTRCSNEPKKRTSSFTHRNVSTKSRASHTLETSHGVKPDPLKIEVLANMPQPKNHEELATFLGMVNYLSRFIRDLSTINHPSRDIEKRFSLASRAHTGWKKTSSLSSIISAILIQTLKN